MRNLCAINMGCKDFDLKKKMLKAIYCAFERASIYVDFV